MMHFLTLLVTGLACLATASAVAGQSTRKPQTITGRVVRVADGDTLTVQRGLTLVKVRLAGVDAPERKQAGGLEQQLKGPPCTHCNRKTLSGW